MSYLSLPGGWQSAGLHHQLACLATERAKAGAAVVHTRLGELSTGARSCWLTAPSLREAPGVAAPAEASLLARRFPPLSVLARQEGERRAVKMAPKS